MPLHAGASPSYFSVRSFPAGLLRACGALAAALAFCACDAPAAMQPVDLHVLAVGDGSSVWDESGGAVSIFKFTTDGTPKGTRFLNSWTAPAAGPGRVVLPKNGSSTGQLMLSGNGKLLTFAGCDADANAAPGELARADKVIGVFDIVSGAFDTTTTRLSNNDNFKATPDVRAVYTIDGSGFWIIGQGFPSSTRGLRYVAAGGTASVSLTTPDANWRNMAVHEGVLHAVSRDLEPRVSVLVPHDPAARLPLSTEAGRAAFVPQAGITGGASDYAEGIVRTGDFLFMGSNDKSAANSGISVYRLDDKTTRWSLVTRLNPADLGAPRHQVSQLAAHEADGLVYLFFDAGGIQANSLNVVTWNPATLSFGDLKVLYTGSAGCTFKGIALSAPRR